MRLTSRAWAVGAIACATLVAFGHTLLFGFVWDDHFLIGNSYFVRSWRALPSIFASHFWAGHADWKMYYRPVVNVTFLLDYQLWQLNPFGYHLTNVLLHLLVSLTVAAMTAKLLGDRLTGFLAGLLFSLHPVHSQSVSFVSGRTDLLATLFFLVAFLLYDRERTARSWGARVGAPVAFVVSLLCKENAIALPFVLLVRDWAFEPPGRQGSSSSVTRIARRLGPMLGVLIGFLLARFVVLSDVLLHRTPGPATEWLPRLLTTLFLASRSAWMMLVPYRASPSQSAYVVEHPGDPAFVIAMVGLGLLLALTIVIGRRSRACVFFAAWFWLTLAPSIALNLLPGSTAIMADRFLYLPSVGVCGLLALGGRRLLGVAGVLRLDQIRRIPAALGAGLILVFTTLTLWRNEDWTDDLRLYYRMADTDPQSLMAAVNLGLVHLSRLEAQVATAHFQRALELAPHNSRVLVGYGLLRAETGHPEEGLRHALRGLGHEPKEGSLHALVGRIYVIAGDYDRASAHYREATRLQPHVPGNHFVLAWTLMKAQHVTPAVVAYERGVEVGRYMEWHHRLVDRLGGELFADHDPERAARYWDRYAIALRHEQPHDGAKPAELAHAEAEIQRLRTRP